MTTSQPPTIESDESEVAVGGAGGAGGAGDVTGMQEGDIVEACVTRFEGDTVWVDLPGGGGATLAHRELAAGQESLVGGARVAVWIDRLPEGDRPGVVSRHMATELRFWDELRDAAGSERVFEGVVVGKVKGGLSVDIGVRAFLPASQIELRPITDLDADAYVGRRVQCQVIEFHSKRGNVVVSRRGLLQHQADARREERLQALAEGDVLEGTVKSLAAYGAFVDVGGVDGLVRNLDLSWGRVSQPGDVVRVGEMMRVKVLSIDRGAGRLGLGVKQLLPDPWESVPTRVAKGDVVAGKVVSLTRYGVFVELTPGVEGLVHVSEMSWTRRVVEPCELVTVGDELRVMVLDVDVGKRRIALGIKQLSEHPWERVARDYPRGTKVEGQVLRLAPFGAFVQVAQGVEGLCHISELAPERVERVESVVKVGQSIEAIVLSVDVKRQRMALSVKAVTTGLADDGEFGPEAVRPEAVRPEAVLDEAPVNTALAGVLGPIAERMAAAAASNSSSETAPSSNSSSNSTSNSPRSVSDKD